MVRSAARLVTIRFASVFRAADDDERIVDRGRLVVDQSLSASGFLSAAWKSADRCQLGD
jgi:hypothetical protein